MIEEISKNPIKPEVQRRTFVPFGLAEQNLLILAVYMSRCRIRARLTCCFL